jgi:F-type H+-transporting ATPase subunit b
MPQLDLATWPTQIFWLAVTFIALYLVISRVAIPRTGGVIEKRKSTIEGDITAAQRLKSDVDATIKAYEAALADSRAKSQAIVVQSRAELNAEIDAERAKLEASLDLKNAEAAKVIAAARAGAMAGVETVAADIAADIVNELAGVKVTKAAAVEAVARAAK